MLCWAQMVGISYTVYVERQSASLWRTGRKERDGQAEEEPAVGREKYVYDKDTERNRSSTARYEAQCDASTNLCKDAQYNTTKVVMSQFSPPDSTPSHPVVYAACCPGTTYCPWLIAYMPPPSLNVDGAGLAPTEAYSPTLSNA